MASLGRPGVHWPDVLPAAGAALLIYAAGLIWNDCADCREDRTCRPRRPIPSGRVRLREAALAGAVLAAGGIALAAIAGLWTCLASTGLVLLVLCYDFVARRIRMLGALNMGACRGASLLMGACAALPARDWPVVVIPAAGVSLFIAAVTWIAARETDSVRIGAVRWVPATIVALTYLCLAAAGAGGTTMAHACALLSVAALLCCGARLHGSPAPELVGRNIGGMIRVLVPLQAALCASAAHGGTGIAAVLLLGWPVSALLARRYCAS